MVRPNMVTWHVEYFQVKEFENDRCRIAPDLPLPPFGRSRDHCMRGALPVAPLSLKTGNIGIPQGVQTDKTCFLSFLPVSHTPLPYHIFP